MAGNIHPFYQMHRAAMEAAMRQRLDLAEPMLREQAHLSGLDQIRQQAMDEFEVVLTQMPYVGGEASRMSDFFMRLLGFIAIGRVLRRHGVPLPLISDIERVCDYLVVLVGSRVQVAGDVTALLDARGRAGGPPARLEDVVLTYLGRGDAGAELGARR